VRLLVFSTLFPWPAVPHHGVFVLERLKAYLRRHGGSAVVVAPVPYVPRLLARGRPVNVGAHGVWGDSRGNLYLAEVGVNQVSKLARRRPVAPEPRPGPARP